MDIIMSTVKSFSVGNGDMFYIDHETDNFTTIDCFYSNEVRDDHFKEMIKLKKKKGSSIFISTHPDEDHLKGLPEFCNQVGIAKFYCVANEATEPNETDAFKKYCKLRDSGKAFNVRAKCSRKWLNDDNDDRESAGIDFLWPIIDNDDFKKALELAAEGSEFNNLSPIFTYTHQSGTKMMWMGDMEHDFLEKIKDEIVWPKIDVLFAPHHGRKSGRVSKDVLKKLYPEVIVIGEALSDHLCYYEGYNTITQNSAGDITFCCSNNKVHVYVSSDTYEVNFLRDETPPNLPSGHYIGSFTSREQGV